MNDIKEEIDDEVVPELLDLTDSTIAAIAGQYADLYNLHKQVQEKSDTYKKRLANIEELLAEKMAEEQIQSVNIKGRTIFLRRKFIASKGAGVSAETVGDCLKKIGWGDLVSESYAANSLQATVRERYDAAIEAKRTGEQYYCTHCCGYPWQDFPEEYPLGAVTMCLDCQQPLQLVKDGIPAELYDLLYVECSEIIGSRKSS